MLHSGLASSQRTFLFLHSKQPVDLLGIVAQRGGRGNSHGLEGQAEDCARTGALAEGGEEGGMVSKEEGSDRGGQCR